VRPCLAAGRVEAGRAAYGCSALNRRGRQHGVARTPRKRRRLGGLQRRAWMGSNGLVAGPEEAGRAFGLGLLR
jgi:hypothetical protein